MKFLLPSIDRFKGHLTITIVSVGFPGENNSFYTMMSFLRTINSYFLLNIFSFSSSRHILCLTILKEVFFLGIIKVNKVRKTVLIGEKGARYLLLKSSITNKTINCYMQDGVSRYYQYFM